MLVEGIGRPLVAQLADPSLIVEEKIDGTNVGIHFKEHNPGIPRGRV
jgi:hypothetical protein